MRISDETYDTLKFLAIYVIPSVETFWLTVGTAWKLPYVDQIGITIGALGMLIAGCIGMSVRAYKEGVQKEHEGGDENADSE